MGSFWDGATGRNLGGEVGEHLERASEHIKEGMVNLGKAPSDAVTGW